MLFAEVSDAVWLAVIGLVTVFINAVTVIATMVIKELLDQNRARVIQEATVIAAKKVEEKLEEVTEAQNVKLDSVATDMKEVHKSTNSMKDQLVKKTEEEAFARGGVEERARADKRGVDERHISSTSETNVSHPSSNPVDTSIKGEANISPSKKEDVK